MNSWAAIVEDSPLVTPINYAEADQLARGLDDYLGTLAPHWRRVLGGYKIIGIAHKVVGVGSVGLRAYVALAALSPSLRRRALITTSTTCAAARRAPRASSALAPL